MNQSAPTGYFMSFYLIMNFEKDALVQLSGNQ
jgi:hypothetical protein